MRMQGRIAKGDDFAGIYGAPRAVAMAWRKA